MLTYITLALTCCLAFLITAARLAPLRLLVGYGAALDIGFSLLIAALFYGTYTGLIVATLAGLFMAIFVTLYRAAFGYTRVRIRRYGLTIYTTREHHPPRWTRKARKP